MKMLRLLSWALGGLAVCRAFAVPALPPAPSIPHYIAVIQSNIAADYKDMFRENGGAMDYPFITPGSQQYADVLWDWDSWLSDVALRQELMDQGTTDGCQQALAYELGCILNFLNFGGMYGWIPITIHRNAESRTALIKGVNIYDTNMASVHFART